MLFWNNSLYWLTLLLNTSPNRFLFLQLITLRSRGPYLLINPHLHWCNLSICNEHLHIMKMTSQVAENDLLILIKSKWCLSWQHLKFLSWIIHFLTNQNGFGVCFDNFISPLWIAYISFTYLVVEIIATWDFTKCPPIPFPLVTPTLLHKTSMKILIPQK